MYEASACYEPNEGLAEDSFSHVHLPNYHSSAFSAEESAAIDQGMNLETGQGHNTLLQQLQGESVASSDQTCWDYLQQALRSNNSLPPNAALPPTPDLLSLFHLPPPNYSSSISFSGLGPDNPGQAGYDPILPLNLTVNPPFLRDLIDLLPRGVVTNPDASLFGGVEIEGGDYDDSNSNGFRQMRDHDAILEFGREMMMANGVGGRGRDGKDVKHYTTEKHRRVQLRDKYKELQNLVPNPTKVDRASVVGDAIDYINELKREVDDLKILVEGKRFSLGRTKRRKAEEESAIDKGSAINERPRPGSDEPYHSGSSSLRSSWLQRKSKNTEVDVRIVEDEVTIKLVQQKRINCLLFVSKVLSELRLDLQHVAGGQIGDFYSFLFNSKICEGCCVYAGAIANKLIEAVDRHYAAIPAHGGY